MGTFKIPIYWLELMKNLTDEAAGMIFRAVFYYAEHSEKPDTSGWSPIAIDILNNCLADIDYQRTHHHSYRVPDGKRAIRNSKEYRAWRAAVYERDHYTCQNCGNVGGKLNAHHIKSFARFPSLRLDVNNGITLCAECHKLAHERGFKYA